MYTILIHALNGGEKRKRDKCPTLSSSDHGLRMS